MSKKSHRIIASYDHGVSVEEWPEQPYWRWIVAHAYCAPAREIRRYSCRASAMLGARRLLNRLAQGAKS